MVMTMRLWISVSVSGTKRNASGVRPAPAALALPVQIIHIETACRENASGCRKNARGTTG